MDEYKEFILQRDLMIASLQAEIKEYREALEKMINGKAHQNVFCATSGVECDCCEFLATEVLSKHAKKKEAGE